MSRVLVVSDSHLSPTSPGGDQQWAAVVAEVARRAPELVVHAGDITMRGASDPLDLAHGRYRLDELPAPWLAIPGNHDIGDCGETLEPVDDTRRQQYSDVFGEATWSVDLGDWRLVGIDIQTLSSPSAAGEAMWAWLADAIKSSSPTALFTHRPLLPLADGETDEPRRYVEPSVRTRLGELIGNSATAVVVSGHVHQWRVASDNNCRHVWAPSTWACLPDTIQPRIGAKVTGIVELELGASVVARLIRPPGLVNLRIGDGLDSPYGASH